MKTTLWTLFGVLFTLALGLNAWLFWQIRRDAQAQEQACLAVTTSIADELRDLRNEIPDTSSDVAEIKRFIIDNFPASEPEKKQ